MHGLPHTGATAPDGVSPRHYGWFRGDTPHVLAANVIWVLVIFGWTMGMMYPFFFLLKKFGMLRITREEELVSCPKLNDCLRMHAIPSLITLRQSPSVLKSCFRITLLLLFRQSWITSSSKSKGDYKSSSDAECEQVFCNSGGSRCIQARWSRLPWHGGCL